MNGQAWWGASCAVLIATVASNARALDLTVGPGNSPYVVSTDSTFDNVTIAAGGTLVANATVTVTGNLTIENNGVVTMQPADLSKVSVLRLNVAGTLTIDLGGQIDVTAKGAPGGKIVDTSTGNYVAYSWTYYGGSHFSPGAQNSASSPLPPTFDDPRDPQFPGGGGGQGNMGQPAGPGGGAVVIQADIVVVNGLIVADAEDRSVLGGASGAGGTINVTATTFSGSGKLSARGGNATSVCCVGVGAGGLIRVAYSTNTYGGTFEVAGGQRASSTWVSGTAFLQRTGSNDVTIAAGEYPLRFGDVFHSLTVANGATLVVDEARTIPSLEVKSGGAITHSAQNTEMHLIVEGLFRLAVGARVDVSGKGLPYTKSYDPVSLLPTPYGTPGSCSGGSHAGRGGSYSSTDTAPPVYDNAQDPQRGGGGAAGGCGGDCGGKGGGLARITAGLAQIDGLIDADGTTACTGGAGGTVAIVASALAGTGMIRARGNPMPTVAAGTGPGGGGGGGIIHLTSGTSTFSGSTLVTGGQSPKVGASGENGVVVTKTHDVAPKVLSMPLSFVRVGTEFSYQPTAVGSVPMTWSPVQLPAGATVNMATGTVSWTPTIEGVGFFELVATNSFGSTTQTFSVSAMTEPSIFGTPAAVTSLGQPYTYAPTAKGTGPITWSIAIGPTDFSVNSTTGAVTWTPTTASTYPICLEASNAVGKARQCFGVVVLLGDGGIPSIEEPRFVSSPIERAQCGVLYQYLGGQPPRLNGTGPMTFSLREASGQTLPDGLAVDTVTGNVSWTPSETQAGLHFVELVARGPGGETSQVFSIDVSCLQPVKFTTCGCSAFSNSLFAVLAWAYMLVAKRKRIRRSDGHPSRPVATRLRRFARGKER